MSQYRDSFTGGGGGGATGGAGAGGRSRDGGEEYAYRGREEDDASQYSPEPRYGFGAMPVPEIDSRPSNRPTQQPRRPLQPMSSRQDGSGVQNFPIPPVPRAPSNSSRGGGGPPPRPPRPSYVPSNLDSSDVQEVRHNPNFSYRLNQQPIRCQPRYSQQSEDDEDFLSPLGHPSMSSSRSIFIGFDPSNPSGPSNSLEGPSTASLGVIPNFPVVPPPAPAVTNKKSLGVGPPPPSARRGTSSYYSQQLPGVSPIPEEPIDRHGSYASSAAIPSNWNFGPMEYYHGDDFIGDSDDNDSEIHIDPYIEAEGGLVRQASLGRKSRPVITEIRSPGSLRGGSKSSSNESFKSSLSVDRSVGVARTASRSPAVKSLPTVPPLPTIIHPGPQARSPVPKSPSNLPTIQQPVAYTADNYMDERFNFSRGVSQSSSAGLEKELGYLTPTSPWATTPTSMKFPVAAAGAHPGRRVPPRLNLDAVREAEARGSLTSLPDLIRRATKLAAVLETGRPDSRWGMRGSFMGNSSASRSNRIDTDSISDILASFPPPALAQGKRPVSQWPLPGDFANESGFSIREPRKEGRRLCGLPVWAFVLLVILALVVISAAIIVPLQLVNLYKAKKDDSVSSMAECKQKNFCLNGGETVVMKDFCGCVCTNGFTGSTCSESDDLSCTTVDLKDAGDGVSRGIQNVTMGNALPRLFEISYPFYNIKLDMARVLAVFSNESISCTAQNALVTFNGKAVPPTSDDTDGNDPVSGLSGLKERQDIVIDNSNSRVPQLDPDAIDFARVVVMYLTNFRTLPVAGDAQVALQNGFSGGRDFGNLSIGNNNTVNFDNRSIKLSDGSVVGSVTAINSTTPSRRSLMVTYLRELLF